MKKAFFLYLFILCFLPLKSFGQIQVITKEHTYPVGENENKSQAAKKAHGQLRATILSEVAAFVEKNYDSAKKAQLVKADYEEAVNSVTGGGAGMKIAEEKWSETSYWVKGEMEVNLSEIKQHLDDKVAQKDKGKNESETVASAAGTPAKSAVGVGVSVSVEASPPAASAAKGGFKGAAQKIGGAAASAAINQTADIAQDAIGGAAQKLTGNIAGGKLGALSGGGFKGAVQNVAGAAANAAIDQAAGMAQDAIGATAQKLTGNIAGGGLKTAAQKTAAVAAAGAVATGGGRFVLSVRSEYIAQISTGVKVNPDISGMGTAFEIGGIGKGGFYFTGELNNGRFYGSGLNFGGCVNRDETVKIVFGVSSGYRNAARNVDFTQNGETLKNEKGINSAVIGSFWKLLIGKDSNLDITNKFMLGSRRNPVSYKRSTGNVTYEEGTNFTYVFGVGYTLTKSKR